MNFVNLLEGACMIAGEECREISAIAHRAGAPKDVYGTESETMFKGVLYHWLRNVLHDSYGPNKLSLEPTKVYSFVDLAYCEDGLSWKRDDGRKNVLVQVKPLAKKVNGNQLYPWAVKRIGEDVVKLQSARQKLGQTSELVLVTPFIDYSAAIYFDKSNLEGIVHPYVPNDFKLIVC